MCTAKTHESAFGRFLCTKIKYIFKNNDLICPIFCLKKFYLEPNTITIVFAQIFGIFLNPLGGKVLILSQEQNKIININFCL